MHERCTNRWTNDRSVTHQRHTNDTPTTDEQASDHDPNRQTSDHDPNRWTSDEAATMIRGEGRADE